MLNRLHAAIAAVCPIDGVSGAQGNVRIDYRPEATAQQRADAGAALTAFDWSDAAHQAWEEDRHPERKTLRQAAAQAVADIDAYLALANPTNAQVAAQVRRLSQITRAVVRRLAQID